MRRPPKVESRELTILTPDQIKAVREALAGHTLAPIFELAIATGMRRGELLAVRWQDVDLDRGVIRVERAVEETAAGLRIKAPKTKRGRRNVGIPPETVVVLREHRREQIALRLSLGQGGKPELVFSDLSGSMVYPDALSRQWANVVRAKRLPPVSFHSLRHTCASTLIAAGVDILTISRRLGHSKPSVTLDVYGHLIEGADAKATQAIAELLR